MPVSAIDWWLASQLGSGDPFGAGWQPHPPPPDPVNNTPPMGADLDPARFRAYYEQIARMNPQGPQPGSPAFETAFQRALRATAPEMSAYTPMQQPAMPSWNALLPLIPGVSGLGGLWQQMQQGGSGPFGDTLPPPYGPYGPGRYFLAPDENMAGWPSR